MADRRARFVEERRAPGDSLAYDGVGADLRQTRERLGLDLADVAAALRIQFVHLDALERGRFQELPGPAYAIGFTRSYARYLLLDGDAAAAQFKAETSITPSRGRLVAPEPLGEVRRPRGLLILASLALLAVVYGGWAWLQERDRLTLEPDAAPPQSSSAPSAATPPRPAEAVPQPVQAAAPPAPAALPPTGTVVAVAPTAPPAATPSVVAAPPAAAPQAPAADAAPAAEAPDEDGDESTPPPSTNAPSASEPPTLAATLQPTAGAATAQIFGLENQDARVLLRARADSWVRIRGANNELVLERTLRTGDTYLVPNRPDLMLWTGNAGGLEVIVDGAPAPALGPSGAARRDIHLDPDRLRRGG